MVTLTLGSECYLDNVSAVTLAEVRSMVSQRVHTLPLVCCSDSGMLQGLDYGSQMTAKRLSSGGMPCRSIFTQLARKVVEFKPSNVRPPSRT